MEQIEKLCSEILNPSEEFTPIPFWFFNDTPDEDKIRRQLEDYVEKGVNGLVLHPRIGVPKEVGYLSEEYFEAVRFIVRTADELGMKIVLYDEGMYPSGSAHGMVVAAHPEYASKGIVMLQEEDLSRTMDEEKNVLTKYGEGEIVTRFADGTYLVYTFTGGTIRGIHFGEDDGEAGAPASADILNPDAVDEFIRLTHDRYFEELEEYFGNTVIAFFTDEPSALGRNATGFREWLPGLDKELVAAGGKTEELQALFKGETNATTVIYHKLIKKYLRENFYRKLSQWCENHCISLMGHPEVSDDVEEQLYFHIPGQDLIMRRVSPETGGITEFDSVQAKLSADIARHLGRRRNANECFGVCFRDNIPWYFKAGDMKWYIDWLGIRGVNLFVPHAFYYSVEGARKEERPPDVGPNNIWWPYYRRFSDYMKRLSYIMTKSVNSAKVAVLCHNNQVPYKEVAALYENQVEFNYLPIALLPECKMENGKLCIQEYEYEAVLNVVNPAWDALLKECDGAAANVQEAHGARLQIFHTAEELLSVKAVQENEAYGRGCRYATVHALKRSRNLRVSGLKKQSVQMYLFSNEGGMPIVTDVLLPAKGCAIRVDLWRGETALCMQTLKSDSLRDAELTKIKLELQPRETVLIMMDETGAFDSLTGSKPVDVTGMTDNLRLAEMKDNHAVYYMELPVKSVVGTEVIHVEADEMVECYVNGELADVGFWSPYWLRVGHLLKQGNNEIKLVVTGNAANIYCDAGLQYGLY